MKKHIFIAIVLLAMMNVSCSSDSDNGTIIPMPPVLDASITYSGTVKAIIDSRCLNCHGDPLDNGAPIMLITLANVQGAVQSSNLIGRVESGAISRTLSEGTEAS